MPETNLPLTESERHYLAQRLTSMEIAFFEAPPRELIHEIPIILADREILDLVTKFDERAVDIIRDASRPMVLETPTNTAGIPLTWTTEPSRRQIAGWIGIGVGSVLVLEVAAAFVIGLGLIGGAA